MNGKLILILGPMFSGKSFHLINYFSRIKYTNKSYVLLQPDKNTRDEHIKSRNGTEIKADRLKSLSEIKKYQGFDYIGIDEAHLFNEKNKTKQQKNIQLVGSLLKNGTTIVISGLNLDYRGKMFEIIADLIELGPDQLKMLKAACAKCHNDQAVFSQMLTKEGTEVIRKLPTNQVIDDGKCQYEPRCRSCFIKK